MKHSAEPVKLAAYEPPPFTIRKVFLEFTLSEAKTRVTSRMSIEKTKNKSESPNRKLSLNGSNLEFISVAIDGLELKTSQYELTDTELTIHSPQIPLS